MRVPVPLPHLRGCRLERVVAEDAALHLEVRLVARTARCPRCHGRCRRVHSAYVRRVTDLPIAGRPVLLHLRVRRFRCPARHCPRRTFVEQVPPLVERYGRRTHALRRALEHVGLTVGGRPGARLGGRLGLRTTRDTLLRVVRALPLPVRPDARVVGVDEFAVRRGHVYGTVLVDVERHRPIDLLDGRSAEQFAAWLRAQTAPEVVCRDRGGCYAEGAARGAPHAIQVADRFHLVANLGDAVERVARQHVRCWEEASAPVAPPPPSPAADRPTGVAATGIAARHRERFARIHALAERGMTITAISDELHLDRKTVRKFVRARSAEAVGGGWQRGASPLLSRFSPHVDRRWQEGCADGQRLFGELQALGYRGSARTLRRYLTALRQGTPPRPAMPALSVRTVAGLVLRPPAALSVTEAALLERLCARCGELATTRRLAQAFGKVVRERQGEAALRRWLDAAASSGLPALVAFASGLRRDLRAVVAGVTLPWSSGVVEGHNTRIKLIKRQMYGRGRFDLLRRRVLLAS